MFARLASLSINLGKAMRRENYLWHIDGYDKLKPFGFCIHGAIDRCSCRILWFDVGPTNNDPSVICEATWRNSKCRVPDVRGGAGLGAVHWSLPV